MAVAPARVLVSFVWGCVMAAFTPGPYEDYFEGRTIIVGDAATQTDLAEFFYCDEHTVSTTREEAEANALLFMAAPGLLAALKLFIEELDDPSRRLPVCEYDSFAQTWKLNPHSHTVQLSLQLEKIARAAIERATGGA